MRTQAKFTFPETLTPAQALATSVLARTIVYWYNDPSHPIQVPEWVYPCPDTVLPQILPDYLEPVKDYYLECLNKLRTGEWKSVPTLSHVVAAIGERDRVLVQQLPHIAVSDPTKIAYWQSGDKLQAKRETPIKFGRWLKKHLSDEKQILRYTQLFKVETGQENPLRFIENDDGEGWEAVYRSDGIRSCMNNSEHGVTELDTWKCYCPAAWGGQDNGLRLAWLSDGVSENPAHAVARAIVHEPSKTFSVVYGDDALKVILKSNGYKSEGGLPEETRLYTEQSPSGSYIHPYVDGSISRGDLVFENGHPVLIVRAYGEFDLKSCDGVLENRCCEHCGREVEDGNYLTTVEDRYGDEIEVCAHCRSADFVEVLDSHSSSGRYVHDSRTICAFDGSSWEYFEEDDTSAMERHNVHYSLYREEYIFGRDVEWSEIEDDYVLTSDCVCLSSLYDEDKATEYVLESNATRYKDDWFLKSDCEDGVPVRGLSAEIDGWLDEITEPA